MIKQVTVLSAGSKKKKPFAIRPSLLLNPKCVCLFICMYVNVCERERYGPFGQSSYVMVPPIRTENQCCVFSELHACVWWWWWRPILISNAQQRVIDRLVPSPDLPLLSIIAHSSLSTYRQCHLQAAFSPEIPVNCIKIPTAKKKVLLVKHLL